MDLHGANCNSYWPRVYVWVYLGSVIFINENENENVEKRENNKLVNKN